MLKSLNIKNFAIIESISLDFIDGLNVITGETGAGKSIIVDALTMLTGQRASPEYVRKGSKKSIIEGVFSFNDSHPVFQLIETHEFDSYENEIIIRREISVSGNSRAFLNDTPVNLGILKQFGELIIDFHGQHDHQSLLKAENHLKIIDIISENEDILKDYQSAISALKKNINDYNELKSKENKLKEKYEIQKYKLNEINEVSPEPGEDDTLEKELKLLENSEDLHNYTAEVYSLIFDGDDSAYNKISESLRLIDQLSRIDSAFDEYKNEIKSASISINEISSFVNDYHENINFDPDRIEDIRVRLLELKGLIKKYGAIESIIEERDKIEQELAIIDNFDNELDEIKEQILNNQKSAGILAKKLSQSRQTSAEKFEKSIIKTLKYLGIENSSFKTEFTDRKLDSYNPNTDFASEIVVKIGKEYFKAYDNGIEKVEFLISTNKGEEPKPIANIASGGEISRIMLSIKSHIAAQDQLPMLVFDEIDIGISGRIGQKVGKAMKELSKSHQIISITHLPQIAALGDRNFIVEKTETAERTSANTRIIENYDKIHEIAKMLSGEKITDAAIKSAKELIQS